MATIQQVNAQADTTRMLRHMVLFQFSPSATPDEVQRIETAFRALPSKISEIKSLESGTNNSPEKLNQGFTHCFFLTFSNEKDRDAYLIHPAHKAFGASLGHALEKVLVFDYWANKL